MDDRQIIELYFDRNESAITETDIKYGNFCRSISKRILKSDEDCEECVNDTYLKLWNNIPPQRPKSFSAYIGRIVRNLSFNRYEKQRAKKRGYGEIPLVLHELAECIPDGFDIENTIDEKVLAQLINDFLSTLSKMQANIFIQRYWYLLSIKEIASENGMSQSNVKMTLLRLRNTLKEHLIKEGIEV